jgi:hypothetical protein
MRSGFRTPAGVFSFTLLVSASPTASLDLRDRENIPPAADENKRKLQAW